MKREPLSNRQKAVRLAREQRMERERSKTPIPGRITAALDVRGLYGPEVDRACGVEEPAVDQWETGELVPTAGQIEALAELTGYPVRFFYMPMGPPVGPAWLCTTEGCEILDDRPDAPVIPLTGRGRLL